MKRQRIFYGWWIVSAMVVALMLGSGLTFWSFTVYIPPLEAEFGWSRAQVSIAYSVEVLISGIAAPFAGRVIDRVGARRSIAVGSIGLLATFLLLAHIQSLWQYVAVLGLQAFASTWAIFLPFQWLLTQWFVRRRGLALGIATAGFGLGGSFVLPLITFFIDRWGWRASYQISGVLLASVFLPVALLLLHDRPADLGLHPDGDPDPPPDTVRGRADGRIWSLRELVRTRSFWLLALVQAFFFGALGSFGVHSVPFFESEGYSAATGATLIAAAAAVRTPARVLAGWSLDRLPNLAPVATGIALLHALCLVLLVFSTGQAALVLFVLFWGIGGGFGPIMVTIVTARTFGSASFATAAGALLSIETVANVLLPPLGGWLFDRAGVYDVAFLLYAASFAVSALAWWVFFRTPIPRPAVSPHPRPLPPS